MVTHQNPKGQMAGMPMSDERTEPTAGTQTGQPESTANWMARSALSLWSDWRLYAIITILMTFFFGGMALATGLSVEPYIVGFFAGWGMSLIIGGFEDRFGNVGG